MTKTIVLSVYRDDDTKGWRYQFKDDSKVLFEGWFDEWEVGVIQAAYEIIRRRLDIKNSKFRVVDDYGYVFSCGVLGYLNGYFECLRRLKATFLKK